MSGISDPDSIAYYRLATLKGCIKLEAKGMRHSGGAVRPRIAAEFGLSPRAKHDTFIAAIQAKMDELIAKKQAAQAEEQK